MHALSHRPQSVRTRSVSLPHFSRGDVGPLTVGILAAIYALVWVLARPSGEPWGRHIGQMLGAEAVLLLSIALVLISTLPWVETWFHGIDRAAVWHRRLAITGLVLLAPHIALASNPDGTSLGGKLATVGAIGLVTLAVWSILPRWRTMLPGVITRPILAARETGAGQLVRWVIGDYERWRGVHRLTGLFVAAGFVHGLLDATGFDASPILRWSFVAIGGIGLAFYVYRELLARHFWPFHDYQVESVRPVGEGLHEVSLKPLGKPLAFIPGQFVLLYVESKRGWQRHPFTISSAPHEDTIRFTVKALGDYTSQLPTMLQPGMPAVLGSPHGRFDWRSGSDHQVWIGAGVGVTPFLSWLRSFDAGVPDDLDFYYTSRGEAPFADEIRAIALRHPSLHAHLIDTSIDGHLTPEQVLATVTAAPGNLSVFMCGPERMLQQFQSAFRRAGVPRSQIHFEYFNVR